MPRSVSFTIAILSIGGRSRCSAPNDLFAVESEDDEFIGCFAREVGELVVFGAAFAQRQHLEPDHGVGDVLFFSSANSIMRRG